MNREKERGAEAKKGRVVIISIVHIMSFYIVTIIWVISYKMMPLIVW